MDMTAGLPNCTHGVMTRQLVGDIGHVSKPIPFLFVVRPSGLLGPLASEDFEHVLNAFARLDNVADRKYVGSIIVNEVNGRYYEAALGRQWMVGMSLAYPF